MRKILGIVSAVVAVLSIVAGVIVFAVKLDNNQPSDDRPTTRIYDPEEVTADDYANGTQLAINAKPGETLSLAYPNTEAACNAFTNGPETYSAMVPALNALVASDYVDVSRQAILVERDLSYRLDHHVNYQRLISLCVTLYPPAIPSV